jgi:hypothetical protein
LLRLRERKTPRCADLIVFIDNEANDLADVLIGSDLDVDMRLTAGACITMIAASSSNEGEPMTSI